jgi:type II secretory pathway component GspD/PulD (secretin)
VLGDIPVAGALFRSKQTDRTKTETLIFVEARVLHSEPAVARHQSHSDFRLGEAYVTGELHDNPLEAAMHRQGHDTYLPPHSRETPTAWERLRRNFRKAKTETDDIIQ